jgi:hypothetical protein
MMDMILSDVVNNLSKEKNALTQQNKELRALLSEWRERWFLGKGLTLELDRATQKALKEPDGI